MFKKITLIALLGFIFSSVSMADEIDEGRQIYEKGALANGELLTGLSANDYKLVGQEAACANCHRPSGMGGVEGKTFMPPISANFLFDPEKHALAVTDPSHPMGLTVKDHAYNDSSLATMISTGINYQGRTVNMTMPRYALDDKSMKSLIAYLHQLSSTPSSGVMPGELHFATVFTPEVDEQTKQMVKAEIEAFALQHNSNMSVAQHHRRIGFDRLRQNNFNWIFHFWDLKGDASHWTSQLEELYTQQPVFAFVSGVSFQSAEPIQQFCESHKTPCLLRSELYAPNLTGRYNLYYSKGMGLDAKLFSSALKQGVIKKPSHVIQLYAPDVLGEKVSSELSVQLKSLNVPSERIVLTNENLPVVRKKIQTLHPNAMIVCWCEQTELDRIGNIKLSKQSKVYLSGSLLFMKSGIKELTGPWEHAKIIYPYEMPDKRLRQLSNFYAWVLGHQFKPINEVIQSDTYISLLVLQEAIAEMVDNLYKDYLVEKVENIFGMSFDYWGMYSRPSLGPIQRYANTSGYITKFEGKKLVPESERIVEE